jgi:hypothetical protein
MTNDNEDDQFDHESRNATLESGNFVPPSGTLFEAIFQELKRKDERKKSKHSFSAMISRLQSQRAEK